MKEDITNCSKMQNNEVGRLWIKWGFFEIKKHIWKENFLS